MDTFDGLKLYEDFKNMKDCLYIDLDSESSDKMLYKCSDHISKKLNQSLEKKDVIEGFYSKSFCPDGTTSVNNMCVEVCQNCKYNDNNFGSSNLGYLYNRGVDKKEIKNLKNDEEIFNYIVIDVPDN